jgi:hypothetical protein
MRVAYWLRMTRADTVIRTQLQPLSCKPWLITQIFARYGFASIKRLSASPDMRRAKRYSCDGLGERWFG